MDRRAARRLAIGAIATLAVVVAALAATRPAAPPPAIPAQDHARPPAIPPPDPVPWTTVRWQRLAGAVPAGPEPGHARFDGMIVGEPGLVGWGRAPAPGRNQFNEVGAVFLSAAGERWQTVPIEAGVAPGDTAEIRLLATDGTWLLALGGVCCDREERQAAWRSADGTTWQRHPLDHDLEAIELWDATGTASGFVAVGTVNGRAAILTSPDGVTWDPVDREATGLRAGAVSDVAATQDGYLAVGWLDDGASYDGAMWRSLGGLAWEAVAPDPLFVGPADTALNVARAFAGGVLVEGNEGPHAERVRCEQLVGLVGSVGPAGRERPGDPDLVCGWGLRTEWLSAGAAAWERLPVRWANGVAPPAGTINGYSAVAPGGPGLVAVAEAEGDPGQSTWATADGRTWERLPAVEGFGRGDSVSGLAVIGRRLVAVGEHWNPDAGVAGSAAVWLGTAD